MSACQMNVLCKKVALSILLIAPLLCISASNAYADPTIYTGVKTIDGSSEPLVFDDDVIIQAGAVITIEAGSEIVMAPGASWYIHGQLVASGTSDNEITFSSSSRSQSWGALCVTSTASVLIEHTTLLTPSYGAGEFRFPGGAVTMHGGQVELRDVTIDGKTHGFYGTSATLTLNNCTFLMGEEAYDYIFIQHSNVYIDGCSFISEYGLPNDIFDTGFCNAIVSNSFFDECTGDAIDIGDLTNCDLNNNLIVGSWDNAITLGETSTGVIHRNVLLGTTSGVEIKYGSYADVFNNTIVGSTYGLQILGYADGTAYNNIFYNCDTLENSEKGLFVEYDHNLSNTFLPRGESNLLNDPKFVQAEQGDYHLQFGSPAINTGRPDVTDPDGSRSDIGAFWFDSDSSAEEHDPFAFSAYIDEQQLLHVKTEYPARLEVWVFTEDGRVVQRIAKTGRGESITELPTKLSAAPLFVALKISVGPKFETTLMTY